MPRRPKILYSILSLLFLATVPLAFVTAAPPSDRGAGKDKGGNRSEPEVLFEVTWPSSSFPELFADMLVEDLNNRGEFVGRYRDGADPRIAFYGTADGIVPVDSLPGLESWVADGWKAEFATSINDSGQIAFSMVNSSLGKNAVFRYDPGDATVEPAIPPQIVLIQEGSWGLAYVNSLGDVTFQNVYPDGYLQVYTGGSVFTPTPGGVPVSGIPSGINDSLQTAQGGSRYDFVSDTLLSFERGTTYGINQAGDLIVQIDETKGGGRPKRVIYRYDQASGNLVELFDGGSPSINDQGDVCMITGASTILKLFLKEGSVVNVDTEVTGTASALHEWSLWTTVGSPKLNNRDTTGLGQIVGTARFSSAEGKTEKVFLLTPVE